MHLPHRPWPAGRPAKTSPLYDRLEARGAQFGDFGGWERPLWFAREGDRAEPDLTHEQTLSLMQTEYIYPRIGDRTSPKEWVEKGRPDIVETAIAEKNRILSSVFPDHISAEIDAAIRTRFDIRL